MSNSKDLDKKLAKWEEKAKTYINYIAVDEIGTVVGYNCAPTPKKVNNRGFFNSSRYGDYIVIGTTDDEELCKNWDKTLRKVNYE